MRVLPHQTCLADYLKQIGKLQVGKQLVIRAEDGQRPTVVATVLHEVDAHEMLTNSRRCARTRQHTADAPSDRTAGQSTGAASGVTGRHVLGRIQVPVSERMWGFKSPLAHGHARGSMQATGLRSCVECHEVQLVVTGWSQKSQENDVAGQEMTR